MPYELIIFACLAVNLGCRDFTAEIQFQSLHECSSVSMGQLALWAHSHPARTIKYWRCQPVGGAKVSL